MVMGRSKRAYGGYHFAGSVTVINGGVKCIKNECQLM